MRFITRICALSAILAGSFVGLAHADVIYTYSGNNFDNVQSPYSTSNHLSGILDFTTALGPNYAYAQVYPVSFTFTGGVPADTLSNDTGASGGFFVQTNASGNIDGWYIGIGLSDVSIVSQYTRYDGAQYDGIGRTDHKAYILNNEGYWTTSVSAIPEPSSLIIGITALTSLWGLGRRRSVRASNFQASTTQAV